MFGLPLSLPSMHSGNKKMGKGIQVGKGVKTEEADHLQASSIIDYFVSESSLYC